MVIKLCRENGSVQFSPEPQLSSSSTRRQRLVWTPVESVAKISVVPRKGRIFQVVRLTEANSDGITFQKKRGGGVLLPSLCNKFPTFSK